MPVNGTYKLYNATMEYNEIIKNFLQQNEMTQTEFAKCIKVTQSIVSRWYLGKTHPGYAIIKSMIEEFDEPAEYWLGLAD